MKDLGREHQQRILIGKNLRNLRESQGMTQTMLGQALGISFQQIQKYERGDSVIPADNIDIRLVKC